MKEYNYYLFDFDGTLCDTTEGIFNSIIYSLDCYGIKETDREKLRYFVGPPLFESYKTLYNVSDDDAQWLIAKYRERYRVKAAEESELYEGIKNLLKELKSRGKKIAIASSKPLVFVEEISKFHNIDMFYDFISAEDFKSNHSSKKDLINACLDFFNKPEKSEVIMVGDRFYDIDGAKGAGVDSAGAVYGFGTEEELTKAGATYILNTPEDLLY
ncbi:MAG: HAD-IA family hydrolase [Clostridia bacterium]|nr:HAD-IA family hydrolase [Clostridia bacterium]